MTFLYQTTVLLILFVIGVAGFNGISHGASSVSSDAVISSQPVANEQVSSNQTSNQASNQTSDAQHLSAATVDKSLAIVDRINTDAVLEIFTENPLDTEQSDNATDDSDSFSNDGSTSSTAQQDNSEPLDASGPDTNPDSDDHSSVISEPYRHPPESHSFLLVIETEVKQLIKSIKFSDVLLVILSTVGVLAVFRALNWTVGKVEPFFIGLVDGLPDLKFKTIPLMPSAQLKQVAHQLLTLGRILVGLFIFYWYLTLVFSLFPATQGIASALIHYVWQVFSTVVKAFGGFLPNLLAIGVITVVAYYLLRFIRFLAVQVAIQRLVFNDFPREWAIPTFKMIRVMVIVFAVIMIAPYLPGFDSPAFQGISVFLGVLVSLGSSSAVSNIVAGVVLVYMRPFKLGDTVKIGEHTGRIKEMSFLVTRVITPKNEEITIPNSAILSGASVNYNAIARQKGVALYTTVSIGYDVGQDQVKALLLEAAKATEGLVFEPEPFVLVKSLDDFYISYELNVYTEKPEAMPKLYSALHSHILELFNAAGVEIMSPHYRATRDGSDVAIPAIPTDATV